ncbi:hypothetical protein H2200_012645 [Cladophialophora chaetospira]|uniref:Epoxide hydrolase N-terminal domain-containing protein n=1 Tax=Cladophialophora chaetospira TaxID=386627 RepID=A0AA38WXC9_9EURO|nr:hypothetical protein H2200_012645 [Cladophialophora chaetospira]
MLITVAAKKLDLGRSYDWYDYYSIQPNELARSDVSLVGCYFWYSLASHALPRTTSFLGFILPRDLKSHTLPPPTQASTSSGSGCRSLDPADELKADLVQVQSIRSGLGQDEPLSTSVVAKATSSTDLNLNYNATFTESIEPFTIYVKEEFLQQTRLKASLTRFVDEYAQPDLIDGPSSAFARRVAAYWADTYDWRQIEASINAKLPQFTTLVHPSPSPANHTLPVPLHFVHRRSNRSDAIPLLFVHGWPGSFLEVESLLAQLTNPPNASLPAFHVVAPSIPGYGFSPSPQARGFGYRAAGSTFHGLMLKLGYPEYVFQGGDAGDFINRYAAHDFPDSVMAGLSNFWIVPPTQEDLDKFRRGESTDDEKYIINLLGKFFSKDWGYGQIQQTRPLKLAHAMTDSPVGLAMWIYDSVVAGVPDPSIWTEELLITWTMMHWIPGPYGAFSLYKNGAADGAISTTGINLLPYVSQPIAISEFPYDLWYHTPLEWARRGGNVLYRTVHETGGHFASLTNPELLLADIWKFFGKAGVVSGAEQEEVE